MNHVMELSLWQVATAYVFVVILLFFVRWKKIDREKEILIASIRMTLQLIIVGYLMVYVFESPSPFTTIFIWAAMIIFSIHNIIKRTQRKISTSLKKIIGLSMLCGTASCLLYFLIIVIGITPWYNPQYFIPIAGMLIGNAMTGISLGINQLVNGIHEQKEQIEAKLMLGATPKTAMQPIVKKAFDAAILPTINSMVGMGIVFLPGMMTGQILSGTSPITAIEYQIAIMLGILGSVTLTVILFVQLGYQTFFNQHQQLIIYEEDKNKNLP